METIVKKLNEIADAVAGEDVEDATNVADALVDIGNAFAGSEGEKTDNVVDALDYIKENVSGGSGVESRNFTLKYKNGFAGFLISIPAYYRSSAEQDYIIGNIEPVEDVDNWQEVELRLPIINGKCGMSFDGLGEGDQWVTYIDRDESSGITFHLDEAPYYISIDEENAVLGAYFDV